MNVEALNGRLLVDTNILLYATLAGDLRFAKAQEVLGLRKRDDVELFVSVQNLAEMYPNLTGPKNHPPDSPEVARLKIESIAGLEGLTILPLSLAITRRALELCENHSIRRQQYFDMQLVATMQEEGIRTLLTENVRDFDLIDGIDALNPFSESA